MDPSTQATAPPQSPSALAGIAASSLWPSRASDYRFAPSADLRRDFSISNIEVERCVSECAVLRAAGACLFVKDVYPDTFALAFLAALPKHLEVAFADCPVPEPRAAIFDALQRYVSLADAGDSKALHQLYLERVYGDSPNFVKLAVGGIGQVADELIKLGIEQFSIVASELRVISNAG